MPFRVISGVVQRNRLLEWACAVAPRGNTVERLCAVAMSAWVCH